MDLPSKSLEQTTFNTRHNIEEHMLIVMDKSRLEEHLSQPLQIDIKQIKIAVTFSTGYNGIFIVLDKNKKFVLVKSNIDDFLQFTIPPGAYEIENFKSEFKKIIIDEDYFIEIDHQFTIKPMFFHSG